MGSSPPREKGTFRKSLLQVKATQLLWPHLSWTAAQTTRPSESNLSETAAQPQLQQPPPQVSSALLNQGWRRTSK